MTPRFFLVPYHIPQGGIRLVITTHFSRSSIPPSPPGDGAGSGPMLDSTNGARRRDVSTRVTRTPHDQLGLTDDDVLSMYRIGLMARLIDEAAFRQNRMGRAPFVVPVSGHEGCQIGTGWAMRRGTDIWLPYYRDLAVVLVAGMTPYEVFLGIFAKADDPSSAGRQMPAHWGSRRLGIITSSSPIATQIPHAAGIAYAAKYRGEDTVVATLVRRRRDERR